MSSSSEASGRYRPPVQGPREPGKREQTRAWLATAVAFAVAIVLSGSGIDGMFGAKAIKRSGGVVIAQDSMTSEFFGMPGAVIQSGSADFILPLDEIALMLVTLTKIGKDG